MKTEHCPDCGAEIGEPHQGECDIERCTSCHQQRTTCSCKGHGPKIAAWSGYYPQSKNFELSLKLSKDKRIRAKKQQCFYNAFKTMFECDEFATATYVEGFAVDLFQFEHGWLEIDSQIVDPTLVRDGIVYFPGLRFNGMTELSKAMHSILKETKEDLPIFYRFGWGGHDSLEFRSAREASTQFQLRQAGLKSVTPVSASGTECRSDATQTTQPI